MDANQELQNLRVRLRAAGYDAEDADGICDQASREISSGITDAIADALNRARQIGESMGAYDFIAELKVVSHGSTFIITTDSGRGDFSTPPLPMLPHLLKNAKTAKDGSRYKRIPIAASKGSKIPTSTVQASEQLQTQQAVAKQQILDEVHQLHDSPDPLMAAQFFAQRTATVRPVGKSEKYPKRTPGGAVEFATASSKQNASTQWVIPAKDMDLTAVLADINSDLSRTIDNIILDATQI